MELISLTQCKRSWPTVSENSWPQALVGLSLHGHLLIEGETSSVLDYRLPPQTPELSIGLHRCLPHLGLGSLAELTSHKDFSELVDQKSWLNLHGIPFDEISQRMLSRLASEAPASFRTWINEKKLSYKEFAVTGLIAEPAAWSQLLGLIPELKLSRQDGARALELASELLAMELSTEEVFTTNKSSAWLKGLEKLRYPQSFAKDQNQKQRLKQIQVPKDFQLSWQRKGDRSGLQISFFASSEEDMAKKLERLSQVREGLGNSLFGKAE